MKLAGRDIKGPNRVTLVLPREEEEDIVFITQAVMELESFDEMVVEPKPPVMTVKGGEKVFNKGDSGYKAQMLDYNLKKIAFIILKSLEPSEVEWDTVELENPSTWLNYNTELQEAGFSSVEINRICQACMQANSLDEDKLEAARQVFLRGQAAQQNESSGPST